MLTLNNIRIMNNWEKTLNFRGFYFRERNEFPVN